MGPALSAQVCTDTDSGAVGITSAPSSQLEVQVKGTSDRKHNYAAPDIATVSAVDLGIPARARKEFDKANARLAKQDFEQALRNLNKAIAIHPTYALAYNNLGVIYARLGNAERAREALQRAISFNDHLALAYLNLGRIDIAAGDFSSAENALSRASVFDRTDPVTYLLLAYVEFMDRRWDEAVATSRKAHTFEQHDAFVHRVAARAFEQKNQPAQASEELEQFLEEEPIGPHADAARKELEMLRAIPH